jgi:hypothetical protein
MAMCLPDGDGDDALTDGYVRFASIRDTSAEPAGFIFFGSGFRLSYTTFAIDNLKVSVPQVKIGDSLTITADVANTSVSRRR